jgi:hypothetical protein
MAVFAPLQPDPVPARRAPGRQAWRVQKVTNVPNEFVSLEGTNADKETESPAADTEEVDGDALLLDDHDEKLEATEVIDADIEKDDT